MLRPHEKLEPGEYAVTVLVKDSGSPPLDSYAQVNVTVCLCDSHGDCKSETGALLGTSMGISFIALIIIMTCVALLLCKWKKKRYPAVILQYSKAKMTLDLKQFQIF